jgi:hypothetical protein
MPEKVLGYILLVVGICIIGLAAFNIFGLLTERTQPVQFFDFDGLSIETPSLVPNTSIPGVSDQLDELFGESAQPQTTEIIPKTMVNQTLNLFVHIFLVGFFVNVGFKVASLGNQLVRPITVKLKEAKEKNVRHQEEATQKGPIPPVQPPTS